MASQKERSSAIRQPGGRAGQSAQPGTRARGPAQPGGTARQPAKPGSQARRAVRDGRRPRADAEPPRDRSAKSAPAQPAPPWLQFTTLVLSVAGLGVSIYLTIAHYTSSSVLACADNGVVNCAKVTTSSESVVFGIFPVAVLGLAFYAFMVAINSPWGWRSKLQAVPWMRLGSVIVGMLFVLYLVYAELIEIGNICLWCTAVHIITFLLFAVIVFQATMQGGTSTARR